MTSDAPPARVFVWVWLPGATNPVVAGVLQDTGEQARGQAVLAFRYAASYRARGNAVSLFDRELPLDGEVHDPRDTPHRAPSALAGCLRDAAPDAWGRRVVNLRLAADPDADLSETAYLMASGSDRIGALDFQEAPDRYVARDEAATLDELLHVAALVEEGRAVPPSLAAAAQHGTSIGGARPKALLDDPGRRLIAKFSSSTDTRPVVKAEGLAMLLAARAGISVPAVEVVRAAGKDVLLVERFDREAVHAPDGTAAHTRKSMISMLTVLGVSEMGSRHTSYAQLADEIRSGPWTDVPGTLRELFTRLVFNVFTGNNDDHLRNHAAFWDGARLTLTPAYDLSPQPRSSQTSTQAIGITRDGRRSSQLRLCREVATDFLLTARDADEIVERVRAAIHDHWDEACDEARLTGGERRLLWGREFCNPYIEYDTP
ncbi:type II toxin-antitoxin system HipA family toxin [Paenibacillus sp. TRM 82003]|uniref:type II toxin-antitoxin system HipA family toxin n=1 Tax=Kineococcus sp. TRM81007 TaxID=2925831 RepID=UPI001F59DE83|nr:HipA domain-containing protein [Kineococcus sp. TRM81007]MCI2239625.1 type II toxin-antitoxin system HipA family toxin [Kineococcus sp. TRM81007]MCI3926093.1 type II toxin-antitoxin system HipA family toxin [Paenibacillus sp. TRM 82003]